MRSIYLTASARFIWCLPAVSCLLLVAANQGTFELQAGKMVVTLHAVPPPILTENVEVQADRLGLARETKLLIGRKVRDQRGKNIGKLEDLALDLESGRVLAGLISAGKNLHLIPASGFATEFQDRFDLYFEKEAIESGPKATPASVSEVSAIESAYAQFNQKAPRFTSARNIKQCVGKAIASQTGEPIGKVQDLVVDVAAGRIVYVMIAPCVGPNPQDNLYVAPGRAFGWKPDGSLVLKASQQHFLASRVVSRQFPTDLVMPELATSIYKHYPALQTTTATSAGSAEAKAAPASQPMVKTDVDLSREVLSEIMLGDERSLLTRITVSSNSGKVTLRGTVNDEMQRNNLVSIAEKVAGQGKVNNELEVRNKPRTAKL